MENERLDDESTRIAMNNYMTEYSNFRDNLEDVTDLDLQIESLMKELDSVIKECVVSTSYVKDESKISACYVRKSDMLITKLLT